MDEQQMEIEIVREFSSGSKELAELLEEILEEKIQSRVYVC